MAINEQTTERKPTRRSIKTNHNPAPAETNKDTLESLFGNGDVPEISDPVLPNEDSGYATTSVAEREVINIERAERFEMADEDNTTIGIFLTAQKEHRNLEGRISGVEQNKDTAYWVLYEGPVTVQIPFAEAFMNTPSELVVQNPTTEVLRRQRQLLECAIGAKIEFSVTSFTKEDDLYIAVASRTSALMRMRNYYFDHQSPYALTVGKDVVAQILTNGEHAAYLTFCGMDVKVTKSNLSYRFIQDVSAQFYVGQTLRVRIEDIKYSAEDPFPKVVVSAKPIEKARFQKNIKRIQKNGIYIGTAISTRLKDNANGSSVTISLFLDNVDVPAFARTTILELGNSIRVGDKVTFLAMGVNSEGFAHGKIIDVIKPRV